MVYLQDCLRKKAEGPAAFLLQPGGGAAWGPIGSPHRITLFTLQSMVGSDIAELLMQDCKKLEKYKRQHPVANLINLTDEDWPVLSSGTRNLLTGEIPPSVETPAQIVEKFTRLLYYGRKKVRTPFSQTSFGRAAPTVSPPPPVI